MNINGIWIDLPICSVEDCGKESVVGDINNNVITSFCEDHSYLWRSIDYDKLKWTNERERKP